MPHLSRFSRPHSGSPTVSHSQPETPTPLAIILEQIEIETSDVFSVRQSAYQLLNSLYEDFLEFSETRDRDELSVPKTISAGSALQCCVTADHISYF